MDFSKPSPILVQYPSKPEAQEGLKPIVDEFMKQGFIIPCISPHNTPGLPGKKPHGHRY